MPKRDWLAVWLIAASLLSLPFVVPHVVGDYVEGIRGGRSPAVPASVLGAYLALQSLGLVLIARGRRSGFVLTFGIGLFWVAGALGYHAYAVLHGRFREDPLAMVWLVGLVLTQSVSAALAAWGGWGRRGREGPGFTG